MYISPGPGCVHLRLRVQVAGRPEGGLSDQRAVVGGSATVQQIFRLEIQKQFYKKNPENVLLFHEIF